MNPSLVVAELMLSELQKTQELCHEDAVILIEQHFPGQFLYDNANGNQAIDKSVLNEFRKITEHLVVWSRSERCWRFKETLDDTSGRQTD